RGFYRIKRPDVEYFSGLMGRLFTAG
ncbi:uncharacterized protein METZ01_LOCUS447864, partial [marine metagenome]